MNREILFRAKSAQTGRWISGYYFEDEDNKSYIGYMSKKRYIPDIRDLDIVEYYENNPTYNWVFVKEEVISETVGEYTGLTDKNGTKIFDGDILHFGNKNYLVFWNGECFQWQMRIRKDGFSFPVYSGQDTGCPVECITLSWVAAEIPILGTMSTEIVGNIYDNPELIEE